MSAELPDKEDLKAHDRAREKEREEAREREADREEQRIESEREAERESARRKEREVEEETRKAKEERDEKERQEKEDEERARKEKEEHDQKERKEKEEEEREAQMAKSSTKGKGKGKVAPPVPAAKAQAKPAPRKPDVKPTVQVKKLFWNSFRLDSDQSTIWSRIEAEGANIDTDQLEVLFGEGSPASRRSAGGADATAAPCDDTPVRRTVRKLQALEPKRRKEIAVMLARLHEKTATLDAVLMMDANALTGDQVELLLRNLPTQDEVRLLHDRNQEYTIDDYNVWDTAEDFMLDLIAIPAFQLRIEVWSYENSFDEQLAEISAAEVAISNGCECVLESQSIRHMLALVLYIGNYLNGGTPRGQADGFEIDTLAKMRTIKMSTGEKPGTLVDFLTLQMELHHPGELADMFGPSSPRRGSSHAADVHDVERIRRASRHRLSDTLDELRLLRERAEEMARAVREFLQYSEDPPLEHHAEILESKLAQLEQLKGRFEKLDARYRELCDWFCMHDRGSRRATHEFFGVWDAFLADVGQARRDVEGRERERLRRERRALTPPRASARSLSTRSRSRGGDSQATTPRSLTPARDKPSCSGRRSLTPVRRSIPGAAPSASEADSAWGPARPAAAAEDSAG